ncbi:MAG: DedA family protein [Rhodospirillales bacterium]|nr:DedA family protein [Rhodospirillales bacterium]
MIADYLGLFTTALLAATLLPMSSEAVIATMSVTGEYHTGTLLVVASGGNTLGSLINWLLGRYCLHWQDRKWFPISHDALGRAANWFNHYGLWSLLLAWVPLIGDPLTLLAGVLRVNIWIFLTLVAISKTMRYAVVLGLTDWVFG